MEIQNYICFLFFFSFFLTHGRFFLLWVVSKWKPDRSELIWTGGGAGGLMPKGLNSLKEIKEQWAAGNPFKTDSVEV